MTERRPIVQIAGQLQELPAGDTLPGAGSGVTRGSTTIDFGAFPGGDLASVDITGQSGITLTSTVRAWLRLEATADHSVDEHLMTTVQIRAGNIVAGTGFTIYGVDPEGPVSGLFSVDWEWSE